MNIFSRMFKARDKPQDSLGGSQYRDRKSVV